MLGSSHTPEHRTQRYTFPIRIEPMLEPLKRRNPVIQRLSEISIWGKLVIILLFLLLALIAGRYLLNRYAVESPRATTGRPLR